MGLFSVCIRSPLILTRNLYCCSLFLVSLKKFMRSGLIFGFLYSQSASVVWEDFVVKWIWNDGGESTVTPVNMTMAMTWKRRKVKYGINTLAASLKVLERIFE